MTSYCRLDWGVFCLEINGLEQSAIELNTNNSGKVLVTVIYRRLKANAIWIRDFTDLLNQNTYNKIIVLKSCISQINFYWLFFCKSFSKSFTTIQISSSVQGSAREQFGQKQYNCLYLNLHLLIPTTSWAISLISAVLTLVQPSQIYTPMQCNVALLQEKLFSDHCFALKQGKTIVCSCEFASCLPKLYYNKLYQPSLPCHNKRTSNAMSFHPYLFLLDVILRDLKAFLL